MAHNRRPSCETPHFPAISIMGTRSNHRPAQPHLVSDFVVGHLVGEVGRSPAFRRLDRALAKAADALATLSEEEFDQLARQEARDLAAALTFFGATGPIGDRFPPGYVLGSRLLEHFARRHPLLATDGADFGTA
jgi:hypothetical protein